MMGRGVLTVKPELWPSRIEKSRSFDDRARKAFRQLFDSRSLLRVLWIVKCLQVEGRLVVYTRRPWADSSISFRSRLRRVSSCFALTTHHIAILR